MGKGTNSGYRVSSVNRLIFLFCCAAYRLMFLRTHKFKQCKNINRYARKTGENLPMFTYETLYPEFCCSLYGLIYNQTERLWRSLLLLRAEV